MGRNISVVLVFVASTIVHVMTGTEVFENSIMELVVAECSSGTRGLCFRKIPQTVLALRGSYGFSRADEVYPGSVRRSRPR